MIKMDLQLFTVPTSGTGRIATGVKNVHAAHMLTDVQDGATTYDTPFRLDGVTDGFEATNNDSVESYYGDNRAAASDTSFGDVDVSISRQQLDDAQEAYFQGASIVNGFIEEKATNNPPDSAIMFETTYSDGASKFTQIDKVKFTPPSVSLSTKTDTTTFQSNSYVGKGISRNSDSRRKRSKIVAAADVSAQRTLFFANANDDAVTGLTLSTTPLDAATGVVISADIVLTYNNEIQESTVNASNIKLVKVSDGTEVTLTWTPDAAKEVWNGAHADLDAATAYILLVTDNVRDVFGQGVEAIVNFTTA